MPDNEDKLLDIAFKAEKRGDRIGAIRLYQQIAEGTSEHSSYARNCMERLEQLGVAAQETAHAPKSPVSAAPISNSDNPFESPAFVSPQDRTFETDITVMRRIQISAMIASGVAVFCVMSAVFSFWMVTVHYGNFFQLKTTELQVSAVIDCLNVIALLVVAWHCWRYSSALQHLLPISNSRIGIFSKRHLWLWIGIGALAILRIAGELVFFLPF